MVMPVNHSSAVFSDRDARYAFIFEHTGYYFVKQEDVYDGEPQAVSVRGC